ncbi:TIGR01777 family oxidoreductase [Fictibacillus phosphorivorans]|uniref:TIGR01777 family oxidoreductase n=1 Tax=Fictibacillus phosphorivorans TaxID=1221500 RepID=UPI00203FEA1E|nr:TIGR01777 family oxidoreductase [Fictibacillus phosphorivorans]MCM3719989.1 TIGR01777 family oxidoreductase [Fictibacillus phosphorivorans]MCM3777654.1 TIGR01777 family oxidoreductase [Fictibacillus phosphorivorans]
MKHILITGGTGFVGRVITKHLTSLGNKVFILTRSHKETNDKNVHYIQWQTVQETELPPIYAVINLAGESINGRWTDEKKKGILNSRLNVTENLLQIVQRMPQKPQVWINASAIGYYGTSESEVFTEKTKQHGRDFLAEVVKAWEMKANEARDLGCRTVFTRFGLILGRDGGVLPQLALPYRFFAGGTVGSGSQCVSWVHEEDVARLIEEVLQNGHYEGPVNVTAPGPVTMKKFGQVLGDVMHRPHWLPAPSLAFKLLFGEMSMLILKGQQVLPEKAMDLNFSFKFPHLKDALQDLLQ